MTARLLTGDALEILRTLDACSVDAVVTDPPAGISFIGIEREAEYVDIAERRIAAD